MQNLFRRLSMQRQGFLLSVLATLLFSSKGIFIKLAYIYQVEPAVLMFIRMMMALPFYLVVFIYQLQVKPVHGINQQSLIAIIFFGLCGYYFASYLDLTGLVYLPASIERLVLYSYPSIVLVLSVLFLHHELTRGMIVSLVVIYAGLLVTFAQDIGDVTSGGSQVLYGGLMVFAAAVSFAIYLVGSEIMMRRISSQLFTALAMIAASIAILFHYLLNYPLGRLWILHPMVYFYCAVIAIFCTVMPSFMLSSGIQRIGAATGSLIGSAGPVLTLVLAVIFLNEKISFFQVSGFVLVIAGVTNIGRLKNNSEKNIDI